MISSLLLSLVLLGHVKCTGDASCKACTSCSSCKHCKIDGNTCGACSANPKAVQQVNNMCKRVVDGDTIVVVHNGEDIKVRLIGVDTPESVDPRKPVQRFAKEASENTRRLVEGQVVRLEIDPKGTDKYGRVLAYVYVGDVLVNEAIIRQGFGHAYLKYPHSKMALFREAEMDARTNRRGLWSD